MAQHKLSEIARLATLTAAVALAASAVPQEARNSVFFKRGKYNFDFRRREFAEYRFSSAIQREF